MGREISDRKYSADSYPLKCPVQSKKGNFLEFICFFILRGSCSTISIFNMINTRKVD